MLQASIRLTVVIVLAALAASCAQPARKTAMVAPVSSQTILQPNSPLKNNVAIGLVSGGEETSPLWTSEVSSADFEEALRLSLRQHTMLAEADAPLTLDAHLVELDQPLMGFDLTVTPTVRYLVKTADGTAVFDQTLTSPYTASFSDSALGVERLRLANEGAIRNSISDFIAALTRAAASDPAQFGVAPTAPAAPASAPGAATS